MTQTATLTSRQLEAEVARRDSDAIAHSDRPGRRREAPSDATGFARGASPLAEAAAAERAVTCSVPRGGGWRPGARWARDDAREDIEAQIAALPTHQRPPMRELGRRSEAATPPFRAMRPD